MNNVAWYVLICFCFTSARFNRIQQTNGNVCLQTGGAGDTTPRSEAAGPLRCYKSANELAFASFFRYIVVQGLIPFVVRGTRGPAACFSCACAAPTACRFPQLRDNDPTIESFVCDVMLPALPAGCCLPHTIYQRHIHVSCARSRPAGTPPSLPS